MTIKKVETCRLIKQKSVVSTISYININIIDNNKNNITINFQIVGIN